jgi:transforming growth factor-beta-induced protein
LNGTVTVVIADIMASNGIVHVIDGVLIPPSMQLPSIVEIATSDDDFSTLVGALQAADLVTTLEGDGPFTVFAPTNYAFEGLDDIPEGDDLKEVLLYHVLAGKYTAEDLLEEQTVTTLQGSDITIQMEDDKIILNGCVTLSVANIEASNGIVHVIKRVLIPTDTH